ncbi:MAG: hypothetical protein AABZ45_00500 [Pseudomonadota bacterium]
MMDDNALDHMLAIGLTPRIRAGDRDFLLAVERRIDEQARYSRERARHWRGFLADMTGLLALIGALMLLSRMPLFAPFVAQGWVGLASPLALVVILWFVGQSGRYSSLRISTSSPISRNSANGPHAASSGG